MRDRDKMMEMGGERKRSDHSHLYIGQSFQMAIAKIDTYKHQRCPVKHSGCAYTGVWHLPTCGIRLQPIMAIFHIICAALLGRLVESVCIKSNHLACTAN